MTCNPAQPELVMEPVATRAEPKWGRVWRYQGTRGVVWRIRYRDATGQRILETLGKEPAWDRKRAEKELRRRLVDVERDGYQNPKNSPSPFAERWQTEYLPGRGLKLTTLDSYRQTINRHLLPALGHHTLTTPRTAPRTDRPLHHQKDPGRPLPENRHQPPARAAGDAEDARCAGG